MKITETLNSGLKRQYSIVVSADYLNKKLDEDFAKIQPDAVVEGYEKGQVPEQVLKEKFGGKVLGKVMQEIVDESIKKHFDEIDHSAATQPQVVIKDENWQKADDIHIEMSYEVLPAIPEVDLSHIRLEKMVATIDEASIDEALGNLSKAQPDFKDYEEDTAAQNGDQVVMDFVGKVDGKAFEGGTAQDYPLVLGSGSFIPGFEDQLLGIKAQEVRNVKVTFPENYDASHLAGKPAIFECTIKTIRQPIPLEINDALAKKFGAKDLNDLRTQVSKSLELEYADVARAVMKRDLFSELEKLVSFELPPTLVESEAQQIAHQLWHAENPEVTDHNHGEIDTTDAHKLLAERRVCLGLFLADIGDKIKVKVSDAELQQVIMQQARQYPGKQQEFLEYVQKNPQMQQQLRATVFEDKVVEHVFDQVTVTEKNTTTAELQQALRALNETPL
ncbi:trigger factor [Candidatus Uabimicrobium amorphum]|uniref:trigger factor n=1 Tax=Uabimicrobium amorphum TaxID=2596890 RepID=UPI00125F0F50